MGLPARHKYITGGRRHARGRMLSVAFTPQCLARGLANSADAMSMDTLVADIFRRSSYRHFSPRFPVGVTIFATPFIYNRKSERDAKRPIISHDAALDTEFQQATGAHATASRYRCFSWPYAPPFPNACATTDGCHFSSYYFLLDTYHVKIESFHSSASM